MRLLRGSADLGSQQQEDTIRVVTVNTGGVFKLMSGNYSVQQHEHEHEQLERLAHRPLKLAGPTTIVEGIIAL